MEHEHWLKVDRLCHSALEVEESQRAAFIKKACGGDESLQHELESLLADAERESFLGAPAMEIAANFGLVGQPVSPAGATIGRYRVVRLLGEGGMGAVYEAEQDRPRRTVALKVIKPGFATAETLRRFQHESQALGRLQHPGIAQIYEASTADTGFGPQPYFAMEFIRGRPLHEYAETRRLSARQRLELMAKICDAVEHAHQRGVIHRDLKPGNILVDETGQPKILDFGVARVTDSDAQLTRQTDLGQLVGTLAYMSPEQVLGDPLALDIRTDVYALGVIVYELLAGRLPYDTDRKPLYQAVEIIREKEPAPLSSIHRSYRGDVDTIVAKALEKDKARRYGSAAELAADIRRHLADEPITARPASASYQLQKFARRHKALVAGMAAVFVVLAAGVVVSTREALRARTAEATAEAVNNFLQNDLLAQASASNQASPSTKPDPHLEVRTALDRAATRIAGKFDRQPEVEAAIRDTIGQTYVDLGLRQEGRKQLERALELRRHTLGAESPVTLKTMEHLGNVVDYSEAEALRREILSIRRHVLGPDHPETLSSMRSLAEIYVRQQKHDQAESLYKQVIDAQQRVLGPDNPETLKSIQGLGGEYARSGKLADAEATLGMAANIQTRVLGPEHPDTLRSLATLSEAYREQQKYAQAEQLFKQVLEAQRRILGSKHPDTLRTMSNFSLVYSDQNKWAQAEAILTEAVDAQRAVLGSEDDRTLISMSNLASIYLSQGKSSQAEALTNEVLMIMRRVLGPEHLNTLFTTVNLAYIYRQEGKYSLAEKYAAQALAGRRHVLPPEHEDTTTAAAVLVMAYLPQGKFAESEPLAREILEWCRKKKPDNWRRFYAEAMLGGSLAGLKKYGEAEPLLLEGYRGMIARKDRPMDAPDRSDLDGARKWIVQLYEGWGKPEKAAEWRKE